MNQRLHPSVTDQQMPPLLQRVDDYVHYGANHFPDRTAFIEGNEVVSYAEAASKIERIAHALIASGVQRGDRIATLAAPCSLALMLFLATASIGAYWLGINPRYTRRELQHPLTDARPVILFFERHIDGRDFSEDIVEILERHGVTTQTIELPNTDQKSEQWAAFLAKVDNSTNDALNERRRTVLPRETCLIVYTSGTTGKPKGTMLSHYGLIYCSRTDARYNLNSDGQRMLCNFPINHIACIGDVCMTTLVVGGTIVFMRTFDPSGILRAIELHRITHLGQIPAMLQMTLTHPDIATSDLKSLRTILWGGNPASKSLIELMRSLASTIVNVFGLTETTGNIIFARGELSLEQFANTIGNAPPEYDVDLFGDDDKPTPDGQIGEIRIRGEFVMTGYWENDDATRAAFTETGWLRTGDLAFRRPDGLITLVGRRGDMFKSGGYNVYPVEVEQVIERHPGVLAAAVVSVSDPLYSEVGAAFVISNSTELDEASLRQHSRGLLANYKIPKYFTFVSQMPMLPNGKVDKRALQSQHYLQNAGAI